MSAKIMTRLLAISITAGMALGIWIHPVHANPPPPSEPTCMSCHEDLYYLHDMGKWYCISEASSRCIDCHGGDPTALTENAAHQGLVAYPIVNGDVSKCQGCHPQDYAEHVRKFDKIAGIPAVHVAIAYTPSSPAGSESTQPGASPYIWQALGVVTLLIVLGGVWWFCRTIRRTL